MIQLIDNYLIAILMLLIIVGYIINSPLLSTVSFVATIIVGVIL